LNATDPPTVSEVFEVGDVMLLVGGVVLYGVS
jgi:hypothetical protein